MIIEISRDKFTRTKVNDTLLNSYRDWFITHPDTWIFSNELKMLLNSSNARRCINKLRCEGMCIISDVNQGYKLTNDKKEIKKCYEDLRNRALRSLTSARLMKKNI